MHELKMGNHVTPYSIRFSRRARRRRIVVKPDKVEVVAPRGDSERALHRIIYEKREWVFAKQAILKERAVRMKELTS
ncbi:MAG: DUF45 domain-containing protein, partial [Candidatus Aegiribacteria sp.]|nr:DUF45 domain-containing protein [Candidatus Aegiribacteria sp.]MBD3295422.1 DUF45 domain-containing protein [Candidatus Fermentibacteria bacterium]